MKQNEIRFVAGQQKLMGLLTFRQWLLAIVAGVIAAGVGFAFVSISSWLPAGFALVAIATVHLICASRYCLPLPQSAVLIATIYYLFAPLINVYYLSPSPLYRIDDPDSYFAFAIPCLWATAIGWSFGLYRVKPLEIHGDQLAGRIGLYRGLDVLIIGGLIVGFALSLATLPSSLATVGMLLANMRYVGVFGWVIAARPGWKARLALVLTLDLVASAASGFFLNSLLWGLSSCVVVMFRQRLSSSAILLGMAAIAIILPCIQHAKWELRRASWGVALADQRLDVFGSSYQLTSVNRLPLLFAKVVESSLTLVTSGENEEFIADTAVRYNQGWIVGRIQRHVPRSEGFANGKTVYDAVIASLFPRFLMPNKLTAGGGETFTKYTGVILNSSTSMNLGFVGEMYANYGYGGGIVGCGVYGLFFGLIFQLLTRFARSKIMVLSFIPYVLNFAVVSEVGLVDVLNYTVKSILVSAVIYYGVPSVFGRFNLQRNTGPV